MVKFSEYIQLRERHIQVIPFYEQDNPSSDRSKVYSLGHRNPFAFVKVPNTGDVLAEEGNPGILFSGDVGGGAWRN